MIQAVIIFYSLLVYCNNRSDEIVCYATVRSNWLTLSASQLSLLEKLIQVKCSLSQSGEREIKGVIRTNIIYSEVIQLCQEIDMKQNDY